MDAFDRFVDSALENGQDPEKAFQQLAERQRYRSPYSRVKLHTTFACPPVPYRSMDWSAIDENSYDGASRSLIGWGETQAEAIADLLTQMAERDDADPFQILLEICHARG